MFFAGLDLSRKRLDVHVVDVAGRTVLETAAPPDADGLRGLVERVEPFGGGEGGDRVDERGTLCA